MSKPTGRWIVDLRRVQVSAENDPFAPVSPGRLDPLEDESLYILYWIRVPMVLCGKVGLNAIVEFAVTRD